MPQMRASLEKARLVWMGRPRKLTEEQLKTLEDLAAIDCPKREIAAIIGIDSTTLSEPHYAKVYEKGQDRGKSLLRKLLWQRAQDGRDSILIFLAKNRLDYHDNVKQEITAKVETNSRVQELLDWLNKLNRVT